MSPNEQGRYMQPLRALGAAASTVGRGEASTYFCGVKLDLPEWLVSIYLTDLNRSDEFLAAVTEIDSKVDTSLARFKLGRYSHEALVTAAKRVWELRSQMDFNVESTGQATDGSGLYVHVDNVERARQALMESPTDTEDSLSALIGVATFIEPALGIHAGTFTGRYLRAPR